MLTIMSAVNFPSVEFFKSVKLKNGYVDWTSNDTGLSRTWNQFQFRFFFPTQSPTLSYPSLPVTLSCTESIFLGATKDIIGYMFTNDEWVSCKHVWRPFTWTCWTSENMNEKPPKYFIYHKGRSPAWCPICSTPTASSCCSMAKWWVWQLLVLYWVILSREVVCQRA